MCTQSTNHKLSLMRLAISSSNTSTLPPLIHQPLNLPSILTKNKPHAPTRTMLPKALERVGRMRVPSQTVEIAFEPRQRPRVLPRVVFEVRGAGQPLDARREGGVCLHGRERFFQVLDGFGWCAAGGGDDVAGLVEVGAEEGGFPALDRFLETFLSVLKV